MLSKYKIHTYNDMYCLNDIVIQCEISKSPKDYYGFIEDKTIYNSQFYVSMDKICDVLTKSKAPKSKELLEYIKSNNTSNLEIVNLNNTITTNFIDHGKNTIHFNNMAIKYFYYNNCIYFKANDIINVVGEVNIKDSYNKEYFMNLFKNDVMLLIKPEVIKILVTLQNENNYTKYINEFHYISLISDKNTFFSEWFKTEIKPSIIRIGKYKSNLPIYNKDTIKKYNNKDCVYILHVKDNIYKYGKTSKLQDRLSRHRYQLDYLNIEKIYELKNINDTNMLEDKIEEYTKINKINIAFRHRVEFFECNNNYTIDKIMENIDLFYNSINCSEKNYFSSTDSESDSSIELAIMKEKTKQLELTSIIEKEKTKQLELELKLKNTITQNIPEVKQEYIKPLENILEVKQEVTLKANSENIPTLEQLNKDFEELRFASHVAKKYNVTAGKINSWMKNHNKNNSLLKKNKVCIDCNEILLSTYKRCNKCKRIHRLKLGFELENRPSLEQLKTDIKEIRFFTSIGLKYNVSDNTIRKWIQNYEEYNELIKLNKKKEPSHTLFDKKESLANELKTVSNVKISKAKPEKKDKYIINKLIDTLQIPNEQNSLEKLKEFPSFKVTKKQKAIKEEVVKQDKLCSDCNIPIYYKSTRCKKCLNTYKIKEGVEKAGRPSLDQLHKDIKELGSMVKVGHKYNVSDNAVRKWIKRYSQVEI